MEFLEYRDIPQSTDTNSLNIRF